MSHFKKITEAENRAAEANRLAEEYKKKYAEKELALKAASLHEEELRGVIETLNLKLTEMKDETITNSELQQLEQQKYIENLINEHKNEQAHSNNRIKELESESSNLREDLKAYKSKIEELETKNAQISKDTVSKTTYNELHQRFMDQSKEMEEINNQLVFEKITAEQAKNNAEKRIKSFQAFDKK